MATSKKRPSALRKGAQTRQLSTPATGRAALYAAGQAFTSLEFELHELQREAAVIRKLAAKHVADTPALSLMVEKAFKRIETEGLFRRLATMELSPCATCGRVMLAGKCCDGPHSWKEVAEAALAKLKKLEEA